MAIAKSADGQAAAATISLSATGIATGDLVIVHAYRNGSTTVPSSPGANWTDILTAGGANTNSRRIGYRIIQAGDNLATIVGTWTNATAIQFIGLTGYNATIKIGGSASGGTNTTTLTTPTVTMTDASGNSWVVAFAGSKATNANAVTLSSTTDEVSSQGALNLATGRGVASYTSRNYSATVNTAANRMDAVEVIAAIPQSPQPTALSMTFTGATPVVTTPVQVSPTVLAMTFTGATPTVTVTNNVLVQPTALAMTWMGATPTVSTPVQVSPSALALAWTGAVSAVATPIQASPTPLAMTLTGAVPAVSTPIQVSPDALALTLTGAVPTVSTPVVVNPSALALALSFATPVVTVGDAVQVTPGPLALTLTFATPTVTVSSGSDIVVEPTALALAIAFATPIVTVSDPPVVGVPQGGLFRGMTAVPYVGPTFVNGARRISEAELAAAAALFRSNDDDELMLLGD